MLGDMTVLYIAWFRSIGMVCFISESCYEGPILQRNCKISLITNFGSHNMTKGLDGRWWLGSEKLLNVNFLGIKIANEYKI